MTKRSPMHIARAIAVVGLAAATVAMVYIAVTHGSFWAGLSILCMGIATAAVAESL